LNCIKKNKKWIETASLVAGLAVFGYIFFSTAFMHTHTLPDGRVVVHSHYADDADEKDDGKDQHSHTDTEFLFYTIISKVNFALLFFPAVLILTVLFGYLSTPYKDIIYLPFIRHNYALRAPPLVVNH